MTQLNNTNLEKFDNIVRYTPTEFNGISIDMTRRQINTRVTPSVNTQDLWSRITKIYIDEEFCYDSSNKTDVERGHDEMVRYLASCDADEIEELCVEARKMLDEFDNTY